MAKALGKLNTLFKYPDVRRKAIYTTNFIVSLNSAVREATNKRKVFPADEFAMKVVYLAVIQASEKWAIPFQNWKPALNRFTIEFEDRLRNFI